MTIAGKLGVNKTIRGKHIEAELQALFSGCRSQCTDQFVSMTDPGSEGPQATKTPKVADQWPSFFFFLDYDRFGGIRQSNWKYYQGTWIIQKV